MIYLEVAVLVACVAYRWFNEYRFRKTRLSDRVTLSSYSTVHHADKASTGHSMMIVHVPNVAM